MTLLLLAVAILLAGLANCSSVVQKPSAAMNEIDSWLVNQFQGRQSSLADYQNALSDYCTAHKLAPKSDGGAAMRLIDDVVMLEVTPANCNARSSDLIAKLFGELGINVKKPTKQQRLEGVGRFAQLKRRHYTEICAEYHNEELTKFKFDQLDGDVRNPVETMTKTFSKMKGNLIERNDPFSDETERKLSKFGTVLDLLGGHSSHAIHKGMIAHRGREDIEAMGYAEGIRYLRSGCELYMHVVKDKLDQIKLDWLPNLDYPHSTSHDDELPITWGSVVLCKRLMAYDDSKLNSNFLGTMAGLVKNKKQ